MKSKKEYSIYRAYTPTTVGIAWRGIWHGSCSYGCYEEKA
mgnify:CR=1 FL=1